MTNPAFLVDGHLEKKFIQHICPGYVVRILQCNGEQVAIKEIAKRVITQCKLLKGRYRPIVVVIDREGRSKTANKVGETLLSCIREAGINDDIIIGVADRMIENWILSDFDIVKKVKPRSRRSWGNIPDGFSGKNRLRKILGGYHETTDGVDLLIKCRPSKMKNSQSFQTFFNKIGHIKCNWLQK